MLIRRIDAQASPDEPLFRKSMLQYSEDINHLKEDLRLILNSIVSDGELPKDVSWTLGIRFIEFMIIEESQNFKAKFDYMIHDEGYESFEVNLKVLLTLLENFKEQPPFTLQRICELLIQGQDYYTQTHQFMFALEKCLNISVGLDFKG